MTNHDPGPLPEIATTCAHCPARFFTPIHTVGEPEQARYVKLLSMLGDHLNRKHKDKAAESISQQMNASLDYSGIIVLSHFNSNDEGLIQFREAARNRLHSFTRKVHVSDSTIEEKVAILALPADKQSAVVELLKQMRNVLEEIPLESQQPASRLVLAS